MIVHALVIVALGCYPVCILCALAEREELCLGFAFLGLCMCLGLLTYGV